MIYLNNVNFELIENFSTYVCMYVYTYCVLIKYVCICIYVYILLIIGDAQSGGGIPRRQDRRTLP